MTDDAMREALERIAQGQQITLMKDGGLKFHDYRPAQWARDALAAAPPEPAQSEVANAIWEEAAKIAEEHKERWGSHPYAVASANDIAKALRSRITKVERADTGEGL